MNGLRFTVQFYIFAAALVCYVTVAVIFCIKISRAKKKAAALQKKIKTASSSYKAIFPASAALMILPLLIPFETWITAVFCAAAVLALYISLKDRLENI